MSDRLRVYVIDDERPAIQRLERLVAARGDATVCGSETDPERALAQCRDLAPDVVLADIEMPGIDGVTLAASLKRLPLPPAIVFVTAFERYAVDAFELAATDYLVKPVRPERLGRALERARVHPRQDKPRLRSRVGERIISVPVDEVRALVAEDKYTTVHYP
ncbi:MAG: LytR/AlgR family response regulator transcription factor, partial [Wenzhouxiangella sp.]